jgi:itaconate CoA-transferase
LTFAELVARLERAQIAYARLNEVDEVFSHPQLRARGRFQPVTTPAGEVDMLLPPVISDAWTSELGSVPALGADTDRILAELGYAREEIAHLHHLGAV